MSYVSDPVLISTCSKSGHDTYTLTEMFLYNKLENLTNHDSNVFKGESVTVTLTSGKHDYDSNLLRTENMVIFKYHVNKRAPVQSKKNISIAV